MTCFLCGVEVLDLKINNNFIPLKYIKSELKEIKKSSYPLSPT